MNKQILTIVSLIIFLLAISCDQDRLEIAQQSVLDLETYYKNANDDQAMSLIATQYIALKSRFERDWLMLTNIVTGDCAKGGGTLAEADRFLHMRKFTATTTNAAYSSFYSNFYQFIRRSNLIIENLPDDTETKKLVIAEAKAFRAWAMMYLVQFYGNPPFVPSSDTELTPPNGDRSEMWAWIEQNFDEAAAVLPSKSGLGDQVNIGGRWTREAALAYKAKAMVWQATGIPGQNIAGNSAKYAEAKTILKNIIDGGKYELWDASKLSAEDRAIIAKVGDPDNPYESLFRPFADFCDENILECYVYEDASSNYTSYVNSWDGHCGGWRVNNGTYNGDLFDKDGAWGYGHITAKFVEDLVDYEGDVNSYRRQATVMTYNEWTALGNDIISSFADNDGYFRKKFITFTDDCSTIGLANNRQYDMRNIVWMRYAEVLLLYAEVQAVLGDDGTGLAALNSIRNRAGLASLGSYTLEDVKKEKRFELVIESDCRWIDVVRWGDAPSEFAGVGLYNYENYGTQTLTPSSGQSVINPKYGAENSSSGLVSNILVTTNADALEFIVGKHELFPYTDSEMSANPNLIQNNGW